MPDNLNNKEKDKNFQQKAKQGKQKTERYQQEVAEELAKTNNNMQQATTKAQQKNQYQQEMAQDFLGAKKTGKDRSGYIIPDMNEEAGMDFNTDKITRTGKKEQKKKS